LRSPVPPRHRADVSFRFLLLFLLVAQVVTGILLSFYYQPSPGAVSESIERIVRDVDWGWLVRGLHHWTGQAAILVAVVALAHAFLRRAYRDDGSTAWYAGVLVVLVLAVSSYSGELLPWDDDAYWRVSRSLDQIESIPIVGANLARILRGGDDVTSTTLSRIYSAHSLFLPWLVWLLLVLDGWMITRRLRTSAGGAG
jgi:quinol-cytochrome oxidoreductase complex cytochrome b subunit